MHTHQEFLDAISQARDLCEVSGIHYEDGHLVHSYETLFDVIPFEVVSKMHEAVMETEHTDDEHAEDEIRDEVASLLHQVGVGLQHAAELVDPKLSDKESNV